MVEVGAPDTELRHLTDDLEDPTVDVARDTWLVRAAAGAPAGFGILIGRDPANAQRSLARVHPEHLGLGLGARLLDAIEARAAERASIGARSRRLQTEIAPSDDRALALVAARGYREVRRLLHLERALAATDPDPGAPPDGLVARPVDRVRDAEAVEALDAACFAGAFGYERQPLEQWRREHLEPALPGSTLVEDRGTPVAFSVLLPGDPPWVELLAVAPASRRRGIATWLLRHAFADLAATGARSVRLAVDADNAHGAPRLYAGVGMRVRRTFAIHERRI
ncbi:MAG: GNAT family N-acetyltransferase [Actinomycetota bacterium]